MNARYILTAVAIVFVIAAATRIARDGGLTSQTRTWLLVAAIFLIVSGWLWARR